MFGSKDGLKFFKMIQQGQVPELTLAEWDEVKMLIPADIEMFMDPEDYEAMYKFFGVDAQEYQRVALEVERLAEEAWEKEYTL